MERAAVRYRLDEHLPHALTRALRRRAIATAAESGAVGLPDDDLLVCCLTEGRVLVTQDRDFLRLHQQVAPHAGIIFCEQGSRSLGEIVAFLLLIADVLDPAEMAGRVEFE